MVWKPAMKAASESGGLSEIASVPIKSLPQFLRGESPVLWTLIVGPKVRPPTDGEIQPLELQVELHAIVSDFEAGIQDGAMFGGAFVEDRIGVVDVNQHAAAIRFFGKQFQQSILAGQREMPHVARFLLATSSLDERSEEHTSELQSRFD